MKHSLESARDTVSPPEIAPIPISVKGMRTLLSLNQPHYACNHRKAAYITMQVSLSPSCTGQGCPILVQVLAKPSTILCCPNHLGKESRQTSATSIQGISLHHLCGCCRRAVAKVSPQPRRADSRSLPISNSFKGCWRPDPNHVLNHVSPSI